MSPGPTTPAHRTRRTLLAAAFLVGAAGCADDTDDTTTTATSAETTAEPTDTTVPAEAPTTAEASDDEAAELQIALADSDVAGLLWMREEEQLAHDVYTALGDEWGLRIFRNIAKAEQRHVDRVAGLLAEFDIDDPMSDRPAGTFTIPEIQDFYDDLVVDGRTSLVAALEVGALVEETDIVDLRARVTDVEAIQTTYDELEQGSQNHLRAFVSQLDARDVSYQPTLLDPADYAAIVAG